MDNLIVIIIVGLIVFLAAFYIYRAKKNGKKCIGCPDADKCGKGEYSCSGMCASCNQCKK